MAARKKAKTKVKRKKAPARKPAARKKIVKKAGKKAARKKPAVRRAAPGKKPAARRVPMARPVRMPPRPAGAPPAPIAGEERIGTVVHYFSHLSVAVVRLDTGSLRVGDMIHITGHTSDFRQRVESMQIEHQPVTEVSAGQEFGLRVTDHARDHDAVYKVTG